MINKLVPYFESLADGVNKNFDGFAQLAIIPSSSATITNKSGVSITITSAVVFDNGGGWDVWDDINVLAVGGACQIILNGNVKISGSGGGGGGGGGGITPVTSTQVSLISSIAGNIPSGVRGYSVYNIGAGNGTFNGVNLPFGSGLSWYGNNLETLGALINFDATGTTFRIDYWN